MEKILEVASEMDPKEILISHHDDASQSVHEPFPSKMLLVHLPTPIRGPFLR